MNYYERHLGDYAKNCGHLSLLEHGIYVRLLDVYYTREEPLAADKVARLIRAETEPETKALQVVLEEFFELIDGYWHQQRADEEITAYQAGEPEREVKKANEDNRLKKHREERAKLFKTLTDAGLHAPWNIKIGDLRKLVEDMENGVSATPPATASPPLPATAPATPATATQTPIPNTQTPVSIKTNPSSSELRPDAAVATPKGDKWGTADDLKAAQFIFARVKIVAPGSQYPNWPAWANDIRLMRERDKRSHRDICELFAWANADSFWKANVLSPSTLRDKWSQLEAKRNVQREGVQHGSKTDRSSVIAAFTGRQPPAGSDDGQGLVIDGFAQQVG